MPIARIALTLVTLCVCAFWLDAQVYDWSLDPNTSLRSHRIVQSDSGDIYTVAERIYGFDSSHVVVQPGGISGGASSAYKLHSPLAVVNDAAAFTGGVLVGGVNMGFNDHPFLIATDEWGTLLWYLHIDSLMHSQNQIVELNTAGTEFSCYSYPGGTYSDGAYRFEGSGLTGPTVALRFYTPSSEFRISAVEPTLFGSVHHVAGGTIYPTDSGQVKNILLMRSDQVSVNWIKSYDLGSNSPVAQLESLSEIVELQNWNLLCIGSYADASNTLQAFLMMVDQQGNVLWCKRYQNGAAGIQFASAHENADSTIWISGSNSSGTGILTKIDPNGNVLSTHTYLNGGMPGLTHLSRFHVSDVLRVRSGEYRELSLDALCDFAPGPTLSSQAYTPQVTSVAHGYEAYLSVATWSPSHQPRPTQLYWNTSCSADGIDELMRKPVQVVPNPTEGMFSLIGSNEIENSMVQVTNSLGMVLMNVSYSGNLDLSDFPDGVYYIRVPRMNLSVKLLKR